jgi:hypothetical protein
MKSILDQSHELFSIPQVIFTGGEPFLRYGDMLDVIQYCRDKYQTPVRIVTNGYWGKDESFIKEKLLELKRSGVHELNISVDDFHQKYIPLEYIKTIAKVATNLEIVTLLAYKTYPNSKLTITSLREMAQDINKCLIDINTVSTEELEPCNLYYTVAQTSPIGRNSEHLDVLLDKSEMTKLTKICDKGCDQVLKDIVVTASGALSPCCGIIDNHTPELNLGDLRTDLLTDVLVKANKTTLYNELALNGPISLIRKISESKTTKLSNGYIQSCQACHEIFSDELNCFLLSNILKEGQRDLLLSRIKHEIS